MTEDTKCLCCGGSYLKDGDLKIEFDIKSSDYDEDYGYDKEECDLYIKQGYGFYADKRTVTAKRCEDCGFIMMWG